MTATISAVLFDYGQVLTGPPHPPAWARMREVTGLSDDAFSSAYWAPRRAYDRGTHTGTAYWLEVGKEAGLTLGEAQVTALVEADTSLWTQPNQPMIDWAQRLQTAGTRTGILSNLGDAMMSGVLATFPWLAHFDLLLWSHTVLLAKPEPDIYRHAAEGLRTAPAEILFVDDREDNIEGASAAGMQAIRYLDQESFELEMSERGLSSLWQTGRF